jgi:hypothetical protein
MRQRLTAPSLIDIENLRALSDSTLLRRISYVAQKWAELVEQYNQACEHRDWQCCDIVGDEIVLVRQQYIDLLKKLAADDFTECEEVDSSALDYRICGEDR